MDQLIEPYVYYKKGDTIGCLKDEYDASKGDH